MALWDFADKLRVDVTVDSWVGWSMTTYARVALPAEAGDELMEAGIAVRALPTRGAGVADTVHLVVEAVNTGTAVVTLAVSIAHVRRAAAALLRRRRPTDPDEIKLSVTRGSETRTLNVNRSMPSAEDEVLDLLLAVFDGAG